MTARRTPWTRTVNLGSLGLAIVSFAAALAPVGWPFELFVHFRWQLAAALVLLAVPAIVRRNRSRLLLASVTAALQLVPLAWAASPSSGSNPVTCAAAPLPELSRLRVVTLNVQFSNHEHARVLGWLERESADVVVLQEVTERWRQALGAVRDLYPHQVLRTREDPYGIGILSRHPLTAVRTLDFASDGLPSLAARVDAGGGPVQLYALHAHWPVVPSLLRARDLALEQAATLIRRSTLPTVLAGDLNLTPFAPAFSRLLESANLDDALRSRRWRPTWRASTWPIALPIDHVLVSRQLCVIDTHIGPDVGSDHRSVVVELQRRADR